MSANDYTLQINDSGSWRNVCKFPREQQREVCVAAAGLALILGSRPAWRVKGDGLTVIADDAAIRRTRGVS